MAELKFGCKGCGADLVYQPGTTSLTCPYCGAQNEIAVLQAAIEELDFNEYLAQAPAAQDLQEILTVKCGSCGAETTFPPNVTSEQCPYCGTNMVASASHSTRIIKPKSLLPFAIDQNKSRQAVTTWLHGLWFAPNDLKKYAEKDRMKGLYIPFWTYDSHTDSQYTGQRGEYYYVTESYTTTENGKQVSKTREVRKTRWYPASGQVHVDFDDVLVMGSNSLPENYADRLQPWDLHNLVPYQEEYLSGFRTEMYQVDLPSGFETAKKIMSSTIHTAICRDISGDEQRVHQVNTKYSDITFKHILLPVWIGSYRFRDKVYHILVNARTSEVQGDRPYSWVKITLLVLFILTLIILLVALLQN